MMDVEIIDNSDFDARLKVYLCSNCNQRQLTELDLRNHLLSCQKARHSERVALMIVLIDLYRITSQVGICSFDRHLCQ